MLNDFISFVQHTLKEILSFRNVVVSRQLCLVIGFNLGNRSIEHLHVNIKDIITNLLPGLLIKTSKMFNSSMI